MNPPVENHSADEPVREYLRDVSLETIDHVQALNLSLFLNPKEAKKLTEKDRDRQVLALIWLLSKCNDEDTIADRVAGECAWQEIDRFRRDPRALWALPEVVPAVQKVKDLLGRNHFLAAAEAATDGDAVQ